MLLAGAGAGVSVGAVRELVHAASTREARLTRRSRRITGIRAGVSTFGIDWRGKGLPPELPGFRVDDIAHRRLVRIRNVVVRDRHDCSVWAEAL